jgi:indolepyruvate ferredoxin oxidoreductase
MARSGHAPRDSLILSESAAELIARRTRDLVAYQDEAYAGRYTALVDRVRRADQQIAPGRSDLTETVARNYYKLLAYKDEYEVARLFGDGTFLETVRKTFTGDYKLQFHMAPPLISRIDPATGRPKKRRFGPTMLPILKALAKLKRLRGTPLDIFGYNVERRMERRLIAEYESTVDDVLAQLTIENYDRAVAVCRVPEMIRGFGPIKAASIAAAARETSARLSVLRSPERRLAS